MKIRKHSESHLVELADGSKWQIFPGDMDLTLNWKPDTELELVRVDDEASSHVLVSLSDNSSVRVLPVDEEWSVKDVKKILREGRRDADDLGPRLPRGQQTQLVSLARQSR